MKAKILNMVRKARAIEGLINKSLFAILFLAAAYQTSLAQPAFKWVMGGQGGSLDEYVQTVATDGSGNVYVAGSFEGTVDFDYTSTVLNLTAAGGFDAFI